MLGGKALYEYTYSGIVSWKNWRDKEAGLGRVVMGLNMLKRDALEERTSHHPNRGANGPG